jgi:hypothetical protein
MRRSLSGIIVLLVLTISLADEPTAVPVKINRLAAVPPPSWKVEKPANRLRSYQFLLPGAAASDPAGEVYVMPDSNPDYEKSFRRWKMDFIPPEGKTVDDISRTTQFDIPGGTTVHILDIQGTWRYKERPFDPRSKVEERPGYRVIWAIVAGPDEATHLRMSGPVAVIDKHYDAFIAWLKSLK